MTAINGYSYLPDSPQPSIVRSSLCWLGIKCRRFTPLIQQAGILGLDAVFFAGKVSSKVSNTVTQSALTALNFMGFVSLPYVGHLILKTARDIRLGYKTENHTVVWMASLKLIELVNNLALLTFSFTAATKGMLGDEDTQNKMYVWMQPWGYAGISLSFLNYLTYLYRDTKTLNSIRAIRLLAEDEQSSYCVQIINTIAEIKIENSQQAYLAAQIRFCMDKDTLGHLLTKVKLLKGENSRTKKEWVGVIQQNIETQLKVNLGPGLGLFIFGEGLLVVEKYYTPNSLVSASINLGAASAYTIKILIENLREVSQRHSINALEEHKEEFVFIEDEKV